MSLNKVKSEVLLMTSWLVAFVINRVTFVYFYVILFVKMTTPQEKSFSALEFAKLFKFNADFINNSTKTTKIRTNLRMA